MKTSYAAFFLIILGVLPACHHERHARHARKCMMRKTDEIEMNGNSAMYTANNAYAPHFDTARNELVALEEDTNLLSFFDENDDLVALNDTIQDLDSADKELTWVESALDEDHLKTVYFDFDNYGIRPDQKNAVNKNVDELKDLLAQAEQAGKTVTIVAEGHASPETGSETYNLLLSEKRAAAVAKELENKGINHTAIKVVGRGQAIPAVVNGKAVTGSREEQWPNRRVELRVISA